MPKIIVEVADYCHFCQFKQDDGYCLVLMKFVLDEKGIARKPEECYKLQDDFIKLKITLDKF